MRRPIRPFVTEYKSRSQKSAPRVLTDEPIAAEPRPRFLEAPTPAPRAREDGHDDGYEAAMKAADLIFGKKNAAAAPIEATPAPVAEVAHPVFAEAEAMFAPPARPVTIESPVSAPTGRILPSLIESEFVQPEERQAEPPPRKRGRPRKVVAPAEPQRTENSANLENFEIEALATIEPTAPRAPSPAAKRAVRRTAPKPEVAFDLEPDDELEPVGETDEAIDSTRRSRRPIQARWVLRTELAAGERWKRRLTDRSRSR